MTAETLLKVLESMEFTRGLERHHLEKLASMASELTFSEGEIIFREGDVGNLLYLIEEGQVAVDTHVPGRGRVTILTVGPGQLLGWSALFTQMRKTASARAVIPTRALAFNAAQLREMCDADHDLGYVLLWRVAEVIASRLKATRLQLLDIFAPSGSE